ncbi:MAG: hypothetical protein J07HB67_01628 [halophilic archaeon J07HB67]|jgi:hypothetical protein|nr:MAG: hypothetical protein J07HB67_01628 [halophilic archaeon J07HB67]
MRLWLVERSFDTRNTVTITYASRDGEHAYRMQATVDRLRRTPATAAVDRDSETVDGVADADRRERYATEARRMAADHDPDDEV